MEIVEREFGKANLSLETGRLARQANGSVLVRYGDTMVLVAATAALNRNNLSLQLLRPAGAGA